MSDQNTAVGVPVAPERDPRRHGHITPQPGGPARCGGPASCDDCQAELAEVVGQAVEQREGELREAHARELSAVYRERTALLTGYTRMWPSVLASSDPAAPNWPVLTISGPHGQMGWHLARHDLDLLQHVPWGTPPAFDGHTTEEKYRRLLAATAAEGFVQPPLEVKLSVPAGTDLGVLRHLAGPGHLTPEAAEQVRAAMQAAIGAALSELLAGRAS